MQNLESFSVSSLTIQQQIDIDGGVPPTRDTSLANDIGWVIGTSAAGWVMMYHDAVNYFSN